MVLRMFTAVLLAAAAVTAATQPQPDYEPSNGGFFLNGLQYGPRSEKQKPGALIYGGSDASPTEFPHMAAIGYKSGKKIKYLCGGSLISPQWVITAGHCVVNTNTNLVPKTVRLGDISPDIGRHSHAQDFDIISIQAHPDYNNPSKYNDIALLQLSQPVELNDHVGIACLNKATKIPARYAIATGWGKTESASYSTNLLKVELPLANQKKCAAIYDAMIKSSPPFKEVLKQGIQPTMLCAGYDEGGKDTCQGDSGGPLQLPQNGGKCKWLIIGLTSFGNKCALPDNYAVYTRISSFIPWINSVIRG